MSTKDASENVVQSTEGSQVGKSLRANPLLVTLTFGFILVLLIVIFMQVARVGYYREKLTAEEGRAALATAVVKYEEAVKQMDELAVRLAESDARRSSDPSDANVRENDELHKLHGDLQSAVSTSRAEMEKARKDLQKVLYDDMPKWQQRRHDRTQLIKACREQTKTSGERGYKKWKKMYDCYKAAKAAGGSSTGGSSTGGTQPVTERMCGPGLGAAECALLGQSGFQ